MTIIMYYTARCFLKHHLDSKYGASARLRKLTTSLFYLGRMMKGQNIRTRVIFSVSMRRALFDNDKYHQYA